MPLMVESFASASKLTGGSIAFSGVSTSSYGFWVVVPSIRKPATVTSYALFSASAFSTRSTLRLREFYPRMLSARAAHHVERVRAPDP
jgi:hypothetical protein